MIEMKTGDRLLFRDQPSLAHRLLWSLRHRRRWTGPRNGIYEVTLGGGDSST